MTNLEKQALKKAQELGDASDEKQVVEVEQKLPAMKKGLVAKIWDKVLFLWDVYKKAEIPVRLQVTIIGALLYLILPVDVVPDFIPGVGLVDDVGVILLVFNEVSKYVVPKAVKKVQATIQESYYLKIDFKLKEMFYTKLLNSVITLVINIAGIAILLVEPAGEISRYIVFGIFGVAFIYTLVRLVLYIRNYGKVTFEVVRLIFKEKSVSRGVSLFVKDKYPIITKIYAGISVAQNFIPGLDTVPDFDLIVKDFIKHYRKRVILVSVLFVLYSALIFGVKYFLAR